MVNGSKFRMVGSSRDPNLVQKWPKMARNNAGSMAMYKMALSHLQGQQDRQNRCCFNSILKVEQLY